MLTSSDVDDDFLHLKKKKKRNVGGFDISIEASFLLFLLKKKKKKQGLDEDVS